MNFINTLILWQISLKTFSWFVITVPFHCQLSRFIYPWKKALLNVISIGQLMKETLLICPMFFWAWPMKNQNKANISLSELSSENCIWILLVFGSVYMPLIFFKNYTGCPTEIAFSLKLILRSLDQDICKETTVLQNFKSYIKVQIEKAAKKFKKWPFLISEKKDLYFWQIQQSPPLLQQPSRQLKYLSPKNSNYYQNDSKHLYHEQNDCCYCWSSFYFWQKRGFRNLKNVNLFPLVLKAIT